MKPLHMIFLGALLLTLQSCCYDYDENVGEKTRPAKIAYNYAKKTLTRQTDVLAMVYIFSQYMKQDNDAARDSVNSHLLRYVKMTHEAPKDGNGGTWTLHSFDEQSDMAHYEVTIHGADTAKVLDKAGARWGVEAIVGVHGEACTMSLVIESLGDDRWKVDDYSFMPISMAADEEGQQYFSETIISEQFGSNNESWTLAWHRVDGHQPFIYAELEGHGQLISAMTPRMAMDYVVQKPLRVVYVGMDYSVQPSAQLWGIVQWQRKAYPFLTFWQDGQIRLLVDDIIEGTIDEITATMLWQSVLLDYAGNVDECMYW